MYEAGDCRKRKGLMMKVVSRMLQGIRFYPRFFHRIPVLSWASYLKPNSSQVVTGAQFKTLGLIYTSADRSRLQMTSNRSSAVNIMKCYNNAKDSEKKLWGFKLGTQI